MAESPPWSWTVLPTLAGLLLALLGLAQGLKLWVPWAASFVLFLLLLWQVWQVYHWPYGRPRWRVAWACFGLTLLLVAIRRVVIILFPTWLSDPLTVYVDAWTQVVFTSVVYGFVWHITQMLHVEVPHDTPRPAAFSIDSHWTILTWSPQMEVLFGWTAADVVGRQTLLETLILPEDRSMYRMAMADIVNSTVTAAPPPRTTRLTLRAQDGTHLRVEMTVQRTHEADQWHFQAEVRQLLPF